MSWLLAYRTRLGKCNRLTWFECRRTMLVRQFVIGAEMSGRSVKHRSGAPPSSTGDDPTNAWIGAKVEVGSRRSQTRHPAAFVGSRKTSTRPTTAYRSNESTRLLPSVKVLQLGWSLACHVYVPSSFRRCDSLGGLLDQSRFPTSPPDGVTADQNDSGLTPGRIVRTLPSNIATERPAVNGVWSW